MVLNANANTKVDHNIDYIEIQLFHLRKLVKIPQGQDKVESTTLTIYWQDLTF